MSTKHEDLEGKHQSLQPQYQGVHQSKRVHHVKGDAAQRACVAGSDDVMVVGIGIGDATASGRHALKPALIERFEINQQRAWLPDLLRINQLLAAAKLPGSDHVLNV